VFEGRVLRKIFGTKREELTARENCRMKRFIICNLHQILLG
jgi:hypothetical protein